MALQLLEKVKQKLNPFIQAFQSSPLAPQQPLINTRSVVDAVTPMVKDFGNATKETAQAWGKVPGGLFNAVQGKPITPIPDLSPSAQRGINLFSDFVMGGPVTLKVPASTSESVARQGVDKIDELANVTKQSLKGKIQPNIVDTGASKVADTVVKTVDDVGRVVKETVEKVDDVLPALSKNPNIAALQKKALELGKNAKNVVDRPPTFLETPEGQAFLKEKTVERVTRQTDKLKQILNPDLVDKVVGEGYEPSYLQKVLGMAKDQAKISSDPGYAYNYFKKVVGEKKVKPELVDLFKPQTPKVDINDMPFEDKVFNAGTREAVDAVLEEGSQRLTKLNELFTKRGKTFSQVVDALESGLEDADTKLLTKWFDIFKAKAELTGVEIPTRQNFFTHLSEGRIQQILNNPSTPDTFGDVLMKPYFANQRTGKLKDYAKTSEAMFAYAKEAMKNIGISPSQSDEIKVSQDIVKEFQKPNLLDWFTRGTPLKPKVDVVGKIQEAASKTDADEGVIKEIYDGVQKTGLREGISETFRSNNDRARMAGGKFYKAFLEPFRRVELETNKFAAEIGQMDEKSLGDLFTSLTGRNAADETTEGMIRSLILTKYSQFNTIAANTFKDAVKSAEFKQPWLKNLANNIFDEYVGTEIRTRGMTEKILGQIRAQTGRGALGLNVTSAINNVLELRRAFSTVGTGELTTALKRVGTGEDLTIKYGIDSISSTALERMRGRTAIGQVLEKFDKGLFYMFDKSERLKDQIMLAAFEEQGLSKNLQGDDLTRFVLQKFDQFAIKYGKGNDIGLFRSPLLKTVLQFGQYPIKDLVIAFDKLGGTFRGDLGDTKYLGKYVIASVAQMVILKELIGKIGFGDQTNTPYDILSNFAKGEVPLSPLVQSLIGMGQNIGDDIRGVELDEYDQEQRDKSIRRSLAVGTIPASGQLMYKTGAALKNQDKGYQEKFGGNVANPVSDDPVNIAKSLVFGPSYDPKRQEYISDYLDEGQGGLTKTQSAVFKNLPREEQTSYYDKSVAENKTEIQNDEYVQSLQEPKKKSLLDFFKKDDEVTGPVWGKQPTTPKEKKEHKALVDATLEAGQSVPDADIRTAYFDGKTYDEATKEEKKAILTKVDDIAKDEFLTEDQKIAIAKASGVDGSDLEYYRLSSTSEDNRTEMFLDWTTQEFQDRNELLVSLAINKRKVGGKSLISTNIVDRLYDEGTISKEEKALMTAIKYDAINDKFYMDRDYKEPGEGGVSASKVKTYINAINSLHKKSASQFDLTKLPKIPQPPKLNNRISRRASRPANLLFTPY